MNIFQSISNAMADVEPISKARTNTQGSGFKYRGIDDVMNELQPVLSKHKIFIVPQVVSQIREERLSKNGGNLTYSILTINHKFYAEDGTFVESTTIGEAMDSGDKASNKAMSVSMKYACLQVFCIPTEDDKDPDAQTHQVKPKQDKQKPVELSDEEKAAEESKNFETQLVDEIKIKTIRNLLLETSTDEGQFCTFYNMPSLDFMDNATFVKSMKSLGNKKSKMPKNQIKPILDI